MSCNIHPTIANEFQVVPKFSHFNIHLLDWNVIAHPHPLPHHGDIKPQPWVPGTNTTKHPPKLRPKSDIGFHQTLTLFFPIWYSTSCILFPSNSVPVFLIMYPTTFFAPFASLLPPTFGNALLQVYKSFVHVCIDHLKY